MNLNRSIAVVALGAAILIPATGCSTSPKNQEERAALSSASVAAMDAFRAEDDTLQDLLNRSAGWAVFPEVGKGGFIVGGSYGRGEVFEDGARIGFADITQGTFGLQAGAQTFSELVVFMRQSDLDRFKKGQFSLAANLSAVAIKPGAAASSDTGKGVVVFVRTQGGLMAEAAVGGQSFSYEPR